MGQHLAGFCLGMQEDSLSKALDQLLVALFRHELIQTYGHRYAHCFNTNGVHDLTLATSLSSGLLAVDMRSLVLNSHSWNSAAVPE